MSSRSFSITAATQEVPLGPEGAASVAFTVTNQTTRPLRGQGQARALGSTDASWLKLQGGLEFDFAASESRQISMNLEVPAKAPPGQYRFRLDVCSVANPDDDFTQGPEVSFTVRDTPPPPAPPKPFPLWILFCILGVILVGGGIAVWQLRKPTAPPPPNTGDSKVMIPNFVGVRLDATPIQQPKGIQIYLVPEYDFNVSSNLQPKDTILSQYPPAGEFDAVGASEIRVKVIVQPDMTIMPNLLNASEARAIEVLRAQIVSASWEYTYTPDPSKHGRVLTQNPVAGQPIAVGRKVTFTVGGPLRVIRVEHLELPRDYAIPVLDMRKLVIPR